MMTENLSSGETAIEYTPKFREYGISVLDGGSSYICVNYCPWCGHTLPTSLRDQWFELLDREGLECDDPDLPEPFQSDLWWKSVL